MSEVRGDCDHGHAAEIMEMARLIGADHGWKATAGALVIGIENKQPEVIGHFNTRMLWQMAAVLLDECAKHKPDGCAMCDASALAAKDALAHLVKRFDYHHDRR